MNDKCISVDYRTYSYIRYTEREHSRYNLLIFHSKKIIFYDCKFCDRLNVFYVDLYFASLID